MGSSPVNMKNKLILFDIDGTILSMKSGLSKQLFAKAVNEVYDIGMTAEKMPSFYGNTDLNIIKDVCNVMNFPLTDFHSKLDEFWKVKFEIFKEFSNTDNYYIYQNVENFILELCDNESYKLGLVTGNFRENAYQKLNVFDLGKFFIDGAFGNDSDTRNLLPELAVKRLNKHNNTKFDNSNTIIIGDSPRDIECAKYFGAKVLAVAHDGFTLNELMLHKPDELVQDFSNLDNIFSILERL